MHQLIYMSTATHLLTDEELQELLERARANNARFAVTGLLLYHEGRFMQLIEGPVNNVRTLYEYIEQDPRHTDTAKLADKEVAERTFPEWDMAFRPIQPQDFASRPGFVLPEHIVLPEQGLSGADMLLLRVMQEHMLRGAV
ncbi:Sensors of blue-light using FAD [Hymenobacter gelipurpurascens]|uniref:Sensors of blue-light using FAD n=1 Tax=Hymenobacter gelipurpurascens TaxID=89968 RepID=A0A212UE88_9BACT|nr:BLUF domain-containing protein [Hymenobacter gelipurpurascens]SNC76557.1 Sensors of blue-light using FAD [Hymenobacter gelipurpurascens]